MSSEQDKWFWNKIHETVAIRHDETRPNRERIASIEFEARLLAEFKAGKTLAKAYQLAWISYDMRLYDQKLAERQERWEKYCEDNELNADGEPLEYDEHGNPMNL